MGSMHRNGKCRGKLFGWLREVAHNIKFDLCNALAFQPIAKSNVPLSRRHLGISSFVGFDSSLVSGDYFESSRVTWGSKL